jgi:hypothetical protein
MALETEFIDTVTETAGGCIGMMFKMIGGGIAGGIAGLVTSAYFSPRIYESVLTAVQDPSLEKLAAYASAGAVIAASTVGGAFVGAMGLPLVIEEVKDRRDPYRVPRRRTEYHDPTGMS